MLSCRTRADHQIKISSSSSLDVTTSDSSNDSNNKIQEKKQRKIKKEIKIIKERGGERERIVEKRISEVKRASKVLRLSQGDNVSFHLISFRFVSQSRATETSRCTTVYPKQASVLPLVFDDRHHDGIEKAQVTSLKRKAGPLCWPVR